MSIIAGESAIVLIEFQGQWLEKGACHALIKRQLKSRGVLENSMSLVGDAREAGLSIVHAPLILDPRRPEGWLAHCTFGMAFTRDTWKSEIPKEFCCQSDFVVTGRYAFDAFVGSNLEQLLRENRIRNVFLCGFITDQCVARTMKTALAKGFESFLVSDCTATFSAHLQRRAERAFPDRVVNHEAVLRCHTAFSRAG